MTEADVPFAGLRRHARALAGAIGIIVLLLVAVPDLAPTTGSADVLLARGRIVEVLATGDGEPPAAMVEVVRGVPDGPASGETVRADLQGPVGAESAPTFGVGDGVILTISRAPDGDLIAVTDRDRQPVLALLIGIFAVAVTVVGGWRGVRSLLALALTLVVLVKVVVPLILAGWDAAWVAILAASAVTVATFLLTEGARPSTLAAIVGTAGSLALVAALATLFDALARFTPLRGSETAGFLASMGGPDIDLGGVVLASIIFGALGVLDDVTVTQAATVHELDAADPGAAPMTLASRAMRVGRSHIAATVNTLVLAYVGASLPLIILFAAGGQDPVLIASSEVVAVEVVRGLVGSIGIVAAVPITTAAAVWLRGRRRDARVSVD